MSEQTAKSVEGGGEREANKTVDTSNRVQLVYLNFLLN